MKAIAIKRQIRRAFNKIGLDIHPLPRPEPPPTNLYTPNYSPWHREDFVNFLSRAIPQGRTIVSRDRCYVLDKMLRQTLPVAGDVIECGVYRGGTAALFKTILEEARSEKKLFLFDTFEGMPETDKSKDWYNKGDLCDTSLDSVQALLGTNGRCVFRKGFIPNTFAGLEDLKFSFAHIDVDIYKSVKDSIEFIWPRLSPGGVVVFDDYGFITCEGARDAVEEFFRGKAAFPLALSTGQAVAFKSTP